MWRVQYAARKVFGVEALDSNSLRQLSSSFFNATGKAHVRRRVSAGWMAALGHAKPSLPPLKEKKLLLAVII